MYIKVITELSAVSFYPHCKLDWHMVLMFFFHKQQLLENRTPNCSDYSFLSVVTSLKHLNHLL